MRLIAMLHGGEWALLMLVFCLGVSAAPSVATNGDWVFFGTYTGPNSQGIYAARFDEVSGELGTPLLAAETKNPSFLALHPNGRFLYAVGELSNFEGRRTGAVSAFAIDRETGKLKLLNQQSSGGAGPCHLAVDTAGQCVLAANYGGGSIAVLPIGADGSLGPATTTIQHAGSSINPQRQAGPHAHYITPDPVNRFALVCDLGLDQVLVYRLAAGQGKLLPHEPPACRLKPGLGPRHLAFHPNGRLVFVINEMGSSLTVLRYDLRGGQLAEVQTISTLPEDFKGQNSCAEVQVHPSGKFVAASNRGHDSIALFTVDPATGKLTLIDHQPTQGKTPRHFAYAPSGRWLLAENQDSGTVKVFRVDTDTGKLKPTGQGAEIGSPVCAVFLGGNRGKN